MGRTGVMRLMSIDVLVVGGEAALGERLARLLPPPGYKVRRVDGLDEAARLVEAEAPDLVLLSFPKGGRGVAELLRLARWSGSGWRSAALVLLVGEEELPEAERFLGDGVCRILNRSASDDCLVASLREVAAPEPRIRVRAFLRLAGSDLRGRETRLAQTENLSTTGMLVRSEAPVAIGTPFGFTLEIASESRAIEGEATVVRVARPASEGLLGFAARFDSFSGDGGSRLQRFLEAEGRRRRPRSR